MSSAIHPARERLLRRSLLLGFVTLASAAIALIVYTRSPPDPDMSSADEGAPPAGAPAGRAQPTALDLGAIVQRARFAFQPDGDAFTAAHASYAVRFARGELEFSPYARAVKSGGIRFGPARIARGELDLGGGAGVARRADDGHLEVSTEAVVEHLRCGPSGVEQSWGFATAPRGAADLVVAVPVVAGTLVARSGAGLHLAAGARGLRYGHATWVDAAGLRTPIEARWEADAIVLRVPADVLDASAYPAVLDPLISPDSAVGEFVTGPAAGDQLQPAVSWDGANHLVVWNELRYGSNWQLFGARVSAAGEPQGLPFQIGADDYDGLDFAPPARPAVSWDGTNHVVFWSRGTCVYCLDDAPETGYLPVGTRVTPDGAVLDLSGVMLDYVIRWSRPAMAASWDGTNHLLVLGDSSVSGMRVSPGLLVQDTFFISTAPGQKSTPAVAWNGASHLVAWGDSRSGTGTGVYGARVTATGIVLDPDGIPLGTMGTSLATPAVAWDGTNHLVVWVSDDAGGGTVSGARVSAAGAVLDAGGFVVGAPADPASPPAVSWDGTDHLVVWATGGADADVEGARVSPGGVVEGGGSPVGAAPGAQTLPALSWNGSTHLVLWQDRRSGSDADLYGTRIDPSGAILDPAGRSLANGPNDELLPSVSWDGTAYLVVWQDDRFGPWYGYTPRRSVRGARVDASGALLDPGPFVIDDSGDVASQPKVSWNGASHLVVWSAQGSAGYGIHAARVSPSGVVLDPAGIVVGASAGGQLDPAVSWDGSAHLVVWTDGRNGPISGADVYGARVTADGAVLDPEGFAISVAAGAQASPAVSWNGTSHVVVWSDDRNVAAGSGRDVYGARVTPGGVVLDPDGVAISAAPADQYGPAVAWDGVNHLVAWNDTRNSSSTAYDVFAARVSADLAVRDPDGIPVGALPGYQSAPVVAFDGSSFLVAWSNMGTDYGWDALGARVAADGTFQPLTLVDTRDVQQPAIAAAAPDAYLVAYRRLDLAPAYESGHVYVRAFTPGTSSSPPQAYGASISVAEDTPAAVTLTASDPDGDPLTFRIQAAPAHGVLEGTLPALTYHPAANYFGPDAFSFVANDGSLDSTPAVVTIEVTPVNDPPVASGLSATLAEDTSILLTLAAFDVDGDPLSYQFTAPAHGTLSGTAPSLTYTPAPNYNGSDAFTFVASDGMATSAPALVQLTVTPVNDAPVASPQSVRLARNTSVAITLTGSDVDGDRLTYAVSTRPVHGTLTGTPPSLTYTPARNYTGSDSFTFSVNDGMLSSPRATVSLTVDRVTGKVATARAALP